MAIAMHIISRCKFTVCYVLLLILLVGIRLVSSHHSLVDVGNGIGSALPKMQPDSIFTWLTGFALVMLMVLGYVVMMCLLLLAPYLLPAAIAADMLYNRVQKSWLVLPVMIFGLMVGAAAIYGFFSFTLVNVHM